jgi:hypothetical protein
MADHYVALNDGVEGFKYSEFITGTASTAGTNQVELGVQDGTNLNQEGRLQHSEGVPALLRKRSAGQCRWFPSQGLELHGSLKFAQPTGTNRRRSK